MTAQCLNCAVKVARALKREGLDAHVVQGEFAVDVPDMILYSDWHVRDWPSEAAMEYAQYHPLHYWAEVDGLIVDASADQFASEVREEIPEIVIGKYEDLLRYKATERIPKSKWPKA